ncbi:MAG: hypothetical protein LAT78_03040 [Roseinatronobacter sp.]|nr:hypothetical protein [Roseinatronobacter sp.]
MFILSPETVSNREALRIRWVPRRYLGRTWLWPRGGGWRLKARIIFEAEALRYALVLSPFVIAAFIWREQAIFIAQAPVLMVLAIYLFEARILRIPRARRGDLMGEDSADAGLDLLRARARTILTRIAAARGMTGGRLHLVIEQSDLLRAPPLTLVSVQSDDGPELLALTGEERAQIADTLFTPPLTERDLLRIGLKRKVELHDLSFEPATVSAHARMAALMAQRQASG